MAVGWVRFGPIRLGDELVLLKGDGVCLDLGFLATTRTLLTPPAWYARDLLSIRDQPSNLLCFEAHGFDRDEKRRRQVLRHRSPGVIAGRCALPV